MPRPCSDDLRMNAVKKVMAGESCRSVAKLLRVAASSVIKWVRRQLDTGSAGPSRMGSPRTPKLAGQRSRILERIKACPAVTLAGLQDWLGVRGVAASVASIWRFLKSCNITRKKLTPVADERDRPDAEHRRVQWKGLQGQADPRKLVFINETRMKTNMSPKHGWGLRGRRAHGTAPFGQGASHVFWLI